MTTLRQEIEEIVTTGAWVNTPEQMTDRICEAIGKAVERMPSADNAIIPSYSDADEDATKVCGAESMRYKAESYWKEQTQ